MAVSLSNFVKKVLLPKEIDAITSTPKEIKEGVSIGSFSSYNFEAVKRLMEVWCKRIDKIIEIDKEVNNGKPSRKSRFANHWRGFTYPEFHALFNTHIPPEDYPFHPVYSQLNKRKGGILTEKQRADALSHLEHNEESYIKALCEDASIEKLLFIFFNEIAQISASLPVSKMKMHSFICASTGSGKSELMRVLFHRMVEQYNQYVYVLIDPHGSLAESVKRLKSVGGNPDRVVYIEPFLKNGFTPTFNPFQIKDTSDKNVTFTAEQIISAIEDTLNREGGNLSEVQINMLEKCVYMLLYKKTATILDLVAILKAEESILKEANQYDPTFFSDEYAKHSNRTRKALLDRIERFLNAPILRNLLGGKSTFDLEKILNTKGKILIVNLGEASEITQVTFGKYLFASIKSVIRKRKKNQGIPTFLLADEVASIMSGSWEYALSQLRGFGLHLVMATQYINQLGDHAETVRQNTAIKIVASDDYEEMKKVVQIPKETSLKDYEFFLKVRSYPVQVFKSPDVILRNPEAFEIDEEAEEKLDTLQIERYYRAINKPQKGLEKLDSLDDNSFPDDDLTPPFDLNIDE